MLWEFEALILCVFCLSFFPLEKGPRALCPVSETLPLVQLMSQTLPLLHLFDQMPLLLMERCPSFEVPLRAAAQLFEGWTLRLRFGSRFGCKKSKSSGTNRQIILTQSMVVGSTCEKVEARNSHAHGYFMSRLGSSWPLN